jgi:hypothetical protein
LLVIGADAGDGNSGRRLALSLDNDLFVPTGSDRDYTAGVALTYARDVWPELNGVDRWLNRVDDHLALGSLDTSSLITTSWEVGSYGFTPEDIQREDIQLDDRPYASLVYTAISHAYEAPRGSGVITSTLTLGALGLDVFEHLQNGVHRLVGSDTARGWKHQISDGGEPTARYQLAYHDYWRNNTQRTKFKTTYFGSVGYLTEAGLALSTRQGQISSPDYRFNPELISYGERVVDTATRASGPEHYFWGGASLRVRAYNAFLQGQFRHSDHSLSASETRAVIAEAWVGYTARLSTDFVLSYVLRVQSSEIKRGEGDRTLVWGGLTLSRQL